jgi:uncharacterized repeat protein (TIGR01451 family)
MKGKWLVVLAVLIAVLSLSSTSGQRMIPSAASVHALQAPILEWQHGGCTSWCETGWYSSPAVVDLDGNGTMEVIGATYTLYVLNGADGSELWRVAPPSSGARAWPGVVVADMDRDGDLEIVTAHGGGYVRVLDHVGHPVWTRQPTTRELRGLSAYDLDGDGTLEVVVTAAIGSKTNTWVYEHDGALRAGWPQLSNESGYAWGVFNDNAAIGDIDGDGIGEIVVPSDVHYVCAYEPDGTQIPAHTMYGGKGWGKVGVHVDHEVDLRGYAHCGDEHRPNFAHSPSAIADVDGDGILEVIVTGNVYDCGTSPYTSLYEMAYIFNGDRSRWSAGGYDWTVIPTPDGSASPLSESYSVIESSHPNPVVADLDGDGKREILFPSYDGRMHAFWLDKDERHDWPYEVYTSGPYRFASEPVVADLDGNGEAEVIFASWVQKGYNQTGKLHILTYQGTALYEVDLPPAVGSWDWNGGLAAPTLANIDDDPNLEVVLNTAHSGLVAYELPGSENARILWGTGRGNYLRTGSNRLLRASSKFGQPPIPATGDVMTYTLTLRNPGPDLAGVRVTDVLPAEVSYLPNSLSASTGSYGEAGGVITWTGNVPAAVPVVLMFGVTVRDQVTTPQPILNTALIDDGLGNTWERQARTIANGYPAYLPSILKND